MTIKVRLTDNSDIANAFNNYFASVAVPSNGNTPDFPKLDIPTLDHIDISESDVLATIRKLKNNLSAGPDGLLPLFCKQVMYSIALPLTIAYKQLLSVAHVPDEWKRAIITPVHKKGPTNLLTNYRPISINCVSSRILERTVVSKIYNHLNNFHFADQHGFVCGHSTCTNLLECLICRITIRHIIIYIDFSKAYDFVPHCMHICGTLLTWIINLFSGRTFTTKINNLLSAVASLLSGVIQGSVIGPLMFLVYINDLVTLLAQ